MFLFILTIILLIPVALLPGLIDEIFSQDELHQMGIYLEDLHN